MSPNAPSGTTTTHTRSHRRSLQLLTTAAVGYGNSVGVLGNDTDADADKLTATLVTGVLHGTLSLNADGSFAYVPTAGFSGTDSFTYKVSDGVLTKQRGRAISVSEHPPVAVNDAYTITHDHTLITTTTGYNGTQSVLANDTDADSDKLTATLVTSVHHGTLTFNADGSFTYVPTAGYTGTDSFTYKVSDDPMTSNTATATA